MTNGRALAAIRPAVLAFILNLAALLAGPFVLPVAAHIRILPATTVADPESTERGVLPAKTALRVVSRPRQADPVLESPEGIAALAPATCRGNACTYTIAYATDTWPRLRLRLVDGGPRGPPAAAFAYDL